MTSINWHTAILPKSAQRALDFLSRQEWVKKNSWYLAGGTALALQVGHRQSVDLDFFTRKQTFSASRLLKHFEGADWKADVVKEGTIYGQLLGAKISFIAYPFFIPREPMGAYGKIPVLAPRDIAVMKVIAISQRGKKRDFADLY